MKRIFITLLPFILMGCIQSAYSNDGGPLTVMIVNVTDATCYGINNGSAQVNGSGGTGPYNYSWSPSGGNSATATNLAPGIYTVTVTDQASNMASTTITIGETSPVQITVDGMSDYAGYNISCFGASNGLINTTASSGAAYYDTIHFAYTGAFQYYIVPAGVTQVTIETWGAQGGANWVNNVNFGGYAKGDLAVIPGETLYVYVGEQPTTITGGFNGGGNGEGAGKGGGGATDVRQGGITYNDRVIVAGGGGGAGNWSGFHVAGGVGGGTNGGDGYREPDYATNPGGQGGTQTGSGLGTCVSFNNPAMTGGFGYGGAPTGCGCEGYGGGGGWYGGAGSGNCRGAGGGSGYLGSLTSSSTANGVNVGHGKVNIIYYTPVSFTYAWSSGQVTDDVSNLAAGTYTYTVSATNGCMAVDTFIVTQPAVLNASIPADTITCFGDNDGSLTAITTGGVPGYGFAWNTSATASVISGLSSGNYTVTVTDANGCTTVTSQSVTEPVILTAPVTSQSDASCSGDNDGSITVSASGGTAAYAYAWAPSGGTAATANGLSAGNYTVTVTDAHGCTTVTSQLVSEPSVLTATVSSQTNVTCFNANDGSISINASGGTGSYTYTWMPPVGSGATVNNLSAANYTVTITDAHGCTTVDSALITQPAEILPSAVAVSESMGNDGSIDLSVSGGTPGYSFSWSNGATTEDINNLPGGAYVVTITDQSGCTATFTVSVGSTLGSEGNIAGITSVYPNPSDGVFYIQLDPSVTGDYSLYVMDMQGKMVYTTKGIAQAQIISIHADEWSAGIYVVKLTAGNNTYTRRVVIH